MGLKERLFCAATFSLTAIFAIAARSAKPVIVLDYPDRSPTNFTASPNSSALPNNSGEFDIVVYGNEFPGIATALAAADYNQQKFNGQLRIALVRSDADNVNMGGHITNGLSYLDRDIALGKKRLSSQSYFFAQMLKRSGSDGVALEPDKADAVLRTMLAEQQVTIISNANIISVHKAKDGHITSMLTTRGTIKATNWVDSTQSAVLARAAGVRFYNGFETIGLPDSTLPLGIPFETLGISIDDLVAKELELAKRFHNPKDQEAQRWLDIAAGGNPNIKNKLLDDMLENDGHYKKAYRGKDFADMRSSSFTVAFAGFTGNSITNWKDSTSPIYFDKSNIVDLDPNQLSRQNHRLSFNSVLYHVNARQALLVADNNGVVPAKVQNDFTLVEKFFSDVLKLRATLKIADQLYVLYAGSIADAKKPVTASILAQHGVNPNQAVGCFSYGLDARGGIEGVGQRLKEIGYNRIGTFGDVSYCLGISHTLSTTVPNMAVLGPASGYIGLAVTAGRIVENNASIGEGLGDTLARATYQRRYISTMSDEEANQITGFKPERAVNYRKKTNVSEQVLLIERLLLRSDLSFPATANNFKPKSPTP
ncbi:MAG: FAD-dependent oxidoreductase [Alphaproteobacteria bacterium]